MSYKSEFIKFMADCNVLTFGDFTTKSGRKTPYFINTGKYSMGDQISRLGEFYADCIMENVAVTENTVLFGPAYKGIPLAVAVAIALAKRGKNVSYCFNRKEAKDHGEGGTLVGHQLKAGDRVLIIEDVITAGTAVREVLPMLKSAGAGIEGLIISADRMEKGQGDKTAIQEIWEEFGIRTYPIVNVQDIFASSEIDGDIKARLEGYMKQYCVAQEGSK